MEPLSGSYNDEGRAYIRDKNIDQLFQSLLAGLIHTRPDDHIGYLLACVEHLDQSDARKDPVFWDTFLNISAESHGNCIPKRVTKDNTISNRQDLKPIEHREQYKDQPSQVETVVSDDDDDDLGGTPEDVFADLGPQGRSVMEGDWSNLPAMPSRTVRIFLSSTFTDFRAERNYLPRYAYPEIQKYCLERGLDFQVVDMRWGVTDEIANDHQVSSLCLEEVRRCQEISAGPNFVVMLGNRYGYQPFPARIEAGEFELFRKISGGLESQQMDLVSEWFLRDDNAIPPHYVLQPIVQKLPNYNSANPSVKADGQTDNDRWIQIRGGISDTLRACATVAIDKNFISKDAFEKYFQSVTEDEVIHGILHGNRPKDQTLCFIRSLTGLHTDSIDKHSARYLDINAGRTDGLAQERLKELALVKIPSNLTPSQIQAYNVPWKGERLEDSSAVEHTDYLHKFCEDFVTKIKGGIQRTAFDDSEQTEIKQLYIEVLHHAKFAAIKTEVFQGRDTEMAQIKEYLLDGKTPKRSPLVVVAESGYGKTSLMAMAAIQVQETCGTSTYSIVRFLGTSPRSSDILQTMQSVILQICLIYNIPLPDSEHMKTYSDTRRLFIATLEATNKDPLKRRLVLFLDAIDQLRDAYNVFTMSWIPKQLPASIYIVVSMLPDQSNCFINTKRHLPTAANYTYLSALSQSSAVDVIQTGLRNDKRRLNEAQMDFITKTIHNNPQPLFLKLILDRALTWNSYTPVDSLELGSTVRDAINKLFETIELRFGKIFVRHALGYISCGKGGLTAIEIEDALSCDDIVLSDVYKYHDPPQDDVLRIPTLMWSRVHHTLHNYLTERQEDSKTVYTWYHRQFWECAEERFLSDENQFAYLHGTLADIFLQCDGISRSIVLENRLGKRMENVDRCVAKQPLNPSNLRKLTVLPYHLFNARRLCDLKTCLLSFDWLLTKLMACDAFSVIKEYSYFNSSVIKDKEFTLMSDFLLLTADALWNDPLLLAYQITERLSPLVDYGDDITKICQEAHEWIKKTTVPILLPTHKLFLKKPNSPLKMQLMCGTIGKLSADKQFLVSLQIEKLSGVTKINVLNSNSKEIITSFESHKSLHYTPTNDGRFVIYINYATVKIHDLQTGDLLQKVHFITGSYKKITVRCLAVSHSDKFLVVGVRLKRGDGGTGMNVPGKREIPMLYLVDLETNKLSTSVPFEGKKVMDRAFFMPDDARIVVSSREKICIMNVPQLDVIYEHLEDIGEILPQTSMVDFASQSFISVVKQKHVAKILIFDVLTPMVSYSKEVNKVTGQKTNAFFLDMHPSSSVFIAGCHSDDKPLITSLCKWSRIADTYEICELISHAISRGPTAMGILPNWTIAFVGWSVGVFTVVDLTLMQELTVIRFEGQTITDIIIACNGEQLLTFEQDNTLRQWDVNMMIDGLYKKSKSTTKTKRSTCKNNANELDTDILSSSTSDSHQCLDVNDNFNEDGNGDSQKGTQCTNDDHIIHVQKQDSSYKGRKRGKQMNVWKHGNIGKIVPCFDFEFIGNKLLIVGLWRVPVVYGLENGFPDETFTDGMHKSLAQYNATQNISLGDTAFGKVHWLGGVQVMYERVENNNRLMWIIDLIPPKYDVVLHAQLDNVYFAMVADVPLNGDSKPYYFVRRQEHLEVYRLSDMTLMKKIGMINIKEDIPSMDSRVGKLRLGLYTCGITLDGRYFLVTNSAVTTVLPGQGSHKALDIVDLKTETYSRVTVPKDKGHKLWMAHSFYVFMWKDNSEPCILNPSRFAKRMVVDHEDTYTCLIKSLGQNYLSDDKSLGVQIINKKREFYIWRIDPLTRLHTFRGHSLGVNSVCVSSNNQLVISGSQDKTVRIWSVLSGSQICSFYTEGAVRHIAMDITSTYISVLAEQGQRRNRCMILKYNEGKHIVKRLTKRLSSSDIWT